MKHIIKALIIVLLSTSYCINADGLSELQEEQAIFENVAQEIIEQAIEAEIIEQNAEQGFIIEKSEDEIRDGFFELLNYIELYNDADKVSECLDIFFREYNATPETRVRDFAGKRPHISLLRFVTHEARLNGQEGKFVLLKEMVKRGGNPFAVEEGERFSLFDENALTCNHLCHPNKTDGYSQMCNYETATKEVKSKIKSRMTNLCSNARRIHKIFEECDSEAL